MGRQSSRMWFGGHDHKDIYFDGHYHKQMYLGSTLLWEKLPLGELIFQFSVKNIDGYNSFPFIFNALGEFVVDWGDGTIESFNTEGLTSLKDIYHLYTGVKPYTELKTIKIYGTLEDIWFDFRSVERLYTVDKPFPKMPNKTNFSSMFLSCENLVEIPDELFKNNPQITNLFYAFGYCTSLTNIPANLFYKCSNVTNIDQIFAGCSSLETLPGGLFANMNKITSLSKTFISCTGLKNIPSNLFGGISNITAVYDTFRRCTSLTHIPAGLFTSFPLLVEITGCFANCTSLISVPESLFDANPDLLYVKCCFYDDTNITSKIPPLWERETIPKQTKYSEGYCTGCYNAENWEDVPTHLYAGYVFDYK